MSLQTEDTEGEQNEIALLRSQLADTNELVKVLSSQLGDLRQRVCLCVRVTIVIALIYLALCLLCVCVCVCVCVHVCVFVVWCGVFVPVCVCACVGVIRLCNNHQQWCHLPLISDD